jgi:hypothetical protein
VWCGFLRRLNKCGKVRKDSGNENIAFWNAKIFIHSAFGTHYLKITG